MDRQVESNSQVSSEASLYCTRPDEDKDSNSSRQEHRRACTTYPAVCARAAPGMHGGGQTNQSGGSPVRARRASRAPLGSRIVPSFGGSAAPCCTGMHVRPGYLHAFIRTCTGMICLPVCTSRLLSVRASQPASQPVNQPASETHRPLVRPTDRLAGWPFHPPSRSRWACVAPR